MYVYMYRVAAVVRDLHCPQRIILAAVVHIHQRELTLDTNDGRRALNPQLHARIYASMDVQNNQKKQQVSLISYLSGVPAVAWGKKNLAFVTSGYAQACVALADYPRRQQGVKKLVQFEQSRGKLTARKLQTPGNWRICWMLFI